MMANADISSETPTRKQPNPMMIRRKRRGGVTEAGINERFLLQEVFMLHDRGATGTLEGREVLDAVRDMGTYISPEREKVFLEKYADPVDPDRLREIIIIEGTMPLCTFDKFRQAFHPFQREDGTVTMEVMKNILLTDKTNPMTEEELSDAMHLLDPSRTGTCVLDVFALEKLKLPLRA